MKKILLSLLAVSVFTAGTAQTIWWEGFQDDGTSTSANGGIDALLNAEIAPDDAEDCDVFLNYDADELPDANDRPGNMYAAIDLFHSTIAGFEYPDMDGDGMADTNIVASSSSWMAGFAPGNANYLVLPCIELTDDEHYFSFKAGVRQTPRYADGYQVGIVTDITDPEETFVPLFRQVQMVEGADWVTEEYADDPMAAAYATCATASGLDGSNGCWYPSTIGDGTGGTGYQHANDFTDSDYLDFFFDGVDETTDVYIGLLESHTIDLTDYIGDEDARICIFHDSDDDNLIIFDDLEVHGLSSVNEIAFETFVSMYPNPVVDVLNFNFTKSVKDNVVINIIDTKGSIVMSEVVSSSNVQNALSIDLSALSAGLYSVAVTVDSQITVSKNIVR